jgi:hypothetical protein
MRVVPVQRISGWGHSSSDNSGRNKKNKKHKNDAFKTMLKTEKESMDERHRGKIVNG